MDITSYLIIIIGIIIDALFIYNDDKYHNSLSIVLKTLASLAFVLLAFHLYKGKGLLVIIALIFDMLGDFILILRNRYKKHKDIIFACGTISFFIAHILYATYLIGLNRSCIKWGIVINIILYVIIAIAFKMSLDVKGFIGILGACYLFIIMFNSGLSITNYHLVPRHENFVYMVGSLIFISSDLVLILHKFGKNSPDFLQIVYRVLYYASQIILALYIGLI